MNVIIEQLSHHQGLRQQFLTVSWELRAYRDAPDGALLPELQRNKDTVRFAVLSAEVLRQHQEQLTQIFIVCL